MENPTGSSCEFSGCTAVATRHVRFGVRLFVPEVKSDFHNLDVCDDHLAEIKQHFLFVNEEVYEESPEQAEENFIPRSKHAVR